MQALVAGVGVNGGHETLLNAQAIVECLCQRCEAVGSTGSIGNNVVLRWVVISVVHANDKGCVFILRWSGDDDLLSTSIQVSLGSFSISEETGGFNDDIDVLLAPLQVLRITLSGNDDLLAINGDGLVIVLNISIEATEHGVILEQMSEGVIVGEVVDSHDLNVGTALFDGTEEVATNTAKAVDTYTNRHNVLLTVVGTCPSGLFIRGTAHCTQPL